MFNVDTIVQQHYALKFRDRFEDYGEEDKKECECGRKIDIDEKMCDVCKNDLKKQFSTLLHDNFTDEEIEVINEIFEGEVIS